MNRQIGISLEDEFKAEGLGNENVNSVPLITEKVEIENSRFSA
jgi:hypothetical protein